MPEEEPKKEEPKKEEVEDELIKLEEPKEDPEREPERETRVEDIEGLFKVIDYVPTKVPTHFSEQIKIYKSGTTTRVYMYINAWIKIYESTSLPKTFVELAPLAVSKSQSSADNWEDWNLSSSIPAGGYAVEILIYANTDEEAGVRQKGSSIDRWVSSNTGQSHTITTLLDSNRYVETYHSSTSTRFWVTGYWI